MRKLEAIRQSGAKVRHIILGPLNTEDLTRLVMDSFNCKSNRAGRLAQLIFEKTAGNPFFMIQFITTLVDEGLITFDYADARWCWDLSRIDAKRYTDNVVDLMAGKLNRLPVETLHCHAASAREAGGERFVDRHAGLDAGKGSDRR